MSNYQKTIAIDFDGVIHRYSKGWHDGTIYDVPMDGAIEALERLMSRGYRMVIFTCRAETKKGIVEVHEWFWRNNLSDEVRRSLEVTDKKPKAIAYIDDRGIRFTNWPDILNYF